MEEKVGCAETKSGKTDVTPRRSSRAAQEPKTQELGFLSSMTLLSILASIPILMLLSLPILSSLFTGTSGSPNPAVRMTFDVPHRPYTELRETPKHQIKYYVSPDDIQSFSKPNLKQLDETAEDNFLRFLDNKCKHENIAQRRLGGDAVGWFYEDAEKRAQANAHSKPSCERLKSMGYKR